MFDPLSASLKISGSGIRAQSARLKIISENIANANSTGSTPGADPFARKTVTFENEMSRAEGTTLTRVSGRASVTGTTTLRTAVMSLPELSAFRRIA